MPEKNGEGVCVIRLRAATDLDFQTVISWIQDQKSCKIWAGPLVHFPLSLKRLKKEIAWSPDNTFCLVDAWNNLLGMGQLLEKKGERRVHLARVIVSPRHRGRGVGERLCRLLMQTGEKRCGQVAFSLNVYLDNQRALNLYRKLGFRQEVSPTVFETDEACVYLVKRHCGADDVSDRLRMRQAEQG